MTGQRKTTYRWTVSRNHIRTNGKTGQATQLPPRCDGIERVSSLTALGSRYQRPNDSYRPRQ